MSVKDRYSETSLPQRARALLSRILKKQLLREYAYHDADYVWRKVQSEADQGAYRAICGDVP
jgi:hypothetical protein